MSTILIDEMIRNIRNLQAEMKKVDQLHDLIKTMQSQIISLEACLSEKSSTELPDVIRAAIIGELYGFRCGWISSIEYRKKYSTSPKQMRRLLEANGYVYFGQSQKYINDRRPTLYVRQDVYDTDPTVDDYIKAQDRGETSVIPPEILAAIATGKYGFRGGWVSSTCYAHECNPRNMEKILTANGYLKMEQKSHRCPEGHPTLYYKAQLEEYGLASRDYSNAQRAGGPPPNRLDWRLPPTEKELEDWKFMRGLG